MSHEARRIEIQGKTFRVGFDRKITRNQREVEAVAYDSDGNAVAGEQMTTARARAFLKRDATEAAATWEELENIAVDMLKLQLEE